MHLNGIWISRYAIALAMFSSSLMLNCNVAEARATHQSFYLSQGHMPGPGRELNQAEMELIVGGDTVQQRLNAAGGYGALITSALSWGLIYAGGNFLFLKVIPTNSAGIAFGTVCGGAAAAGNLLVKATDWWKRAYYVAVAAKAGTIIGAGTICNLGGTAIQNAIEGMYNKHSAAIHDSSPFLTHEIGQKWNNVAGDFANAGAGWIQLVALNSTVAERMQDVQDACTGSDLPKIVECENATRAYDRAVDQLARKKVQVGEQVLAYETRALELATLLGVNATEVKKALGV